MDPWALLAVLLAAFAIVMAWITARHQRTAARIRNVLGVSRDADLAADVSRLSARVDGQDRELATSRESAARLLETIGPGVLTVDRTLRIVEANPAAHGLLDRAAGSLLGKTVMEAFLDTTVESVAQSALDLGAASTEIRQAGADGPAIVIRARRSPAGGAWLMLDDVSELRRLQRIRTEFIDNLSHELRTPLTTVSLLAETLSREAATAGASVPDKMRDRIAKIEVETGHLVQMVNELLDLSRIESGGTIQLADGLDLGRLTADAAERLRLFAERQGVDLQIDMSADLPSVRGDAMRLDN